MQTCSVVLCLVLDVFDQEGLQHSTEHCSQNRTVGECMNHVTDVLEILQFTELAL